MKSANSQRRIRLGVILNSARIPAWQHTAINQIVKSDYADIVLVLLADYVDNTSKSSCDGYDRYLQYEAGKKKKITNDAYALKDATELLSEYAQATLPKTCESGTSDKCDQIVKSVQDKKIDVLLSLADGKLAEELFSSCVDGFWHLQHDYQDLDENHHASAGFWEFITRQPHITSRLLVRRNVSKQAKLAYVTCSRLNNLSHLQTRSEHFWKIAAIVPRVLRRLYNGGSHRFAESIRHMNFSELHEDFQKARPLTRSSLALPIFRYFCWRFRRKIRKKFFTEKWNLMFGFGKDVLDFANFRTLVPPKNKFWADPFVVPGDGVFYLFIEEAELETGVGHISVIEMDDDGNVNSPRKIIERPYHLSYPFIFEYENKLFMVPESADNKSIEVYRCTEFPFEWNFDRYLVNDISAYDATLIEDGGTWWMFANVSELDGASTMDELCLFFADSPLSNDWTPHPMNPIISDVRYARPAGALYRDGGELYRPSQNSSHRYGYGLNINRIIELTKSTYREEIMQEFKPNWDRPVKGLHTYNRCRNLTIIDAMRSARLT